jgi:copper(I)-binding protein
MRYLWHVVGALMVLVLALGALAGCYQGAGTTGPYVPEGGVDANNGSVIANNVWIDAPNGVPAGDSAWMRLSLTNDAQTDDALVGVASPDVRQASLQLAGKPVKKIDIPAGKSVNLEFGQGSGVKLDGFREDIRAGQTWFDVTLTFAKSAPITMSITAGPLGTTQTTPAR